MALWVYKRYEALEEYSEWEFGSYNAGSYDASPTAIISGYDYDPIWCDGYYKPSPVAAWWDTEAREGAYLCSEPSNSDTYCSYDAVCAWLYDDTGPEEEWIYRVETEVFYAERDSYYVKGDYIDTITAEYGTYPDDGEQDGYWWEAIGPAWTAPDLKVKVGGALKTYKDGWVKVDGALKRINKMWAKINGVLREI